VTSSLTVFEAAIR